MGGELYCQVPEVPEPTLRAVLKAHSVPPPDWMIRDLDPESAAAISRLVPDLVDAKYAVVYPESKECHRFCLEAFAIGGGAQGLSLLARLVPYPNLAAPPETGLTGRKLLGFRTKAKCDIKKMDVAPIAEDEVRRMLKAGEEALSTDEVRIVAAGRTFLHYPDSPGLYAVVQCPEPPEQILLCFYIGAGDTLVPVPFTCQTAEPFPPGILFETGQRGTDCDLVGTKLTVLQDVNGNGSWEFFVESSVVGYIFEPSDAVGQDHGRFVLREVAAYYSGP